jgi:hypothetical protein
VRERLAQALRRPRHRLGATVLRHPQHPCRVAGDRPAR